MESKDYAQFIAILVTLVIGVVNLRMSNQTAKKTRYANIASTRRKERIDNFVLFYARLCALAHPDSVKGYALAGDHALIERIVENYSNLNMLLDHRFEADAKLAKTLEELMENALEYYSECRSSGKTSVEDYGLYSKLYSTIVTKTDKSLNIFISVEWTRLREELATGHPISAQAWFKLYNEAEKLYDEWSAN